MKSLPVYDVVLLAPEPINQTAINISQQVTQYDTEFILSNMLYPHISLYMANFTPANVETAQHLLGEIAQRFTPLVLKADRWGKNDQGMLEVFFQKTGEITLLQEQVIAALNPLRTGLRVKDPVGRVLKEYIRQAPDEARVNLEQYGYDEIGNFFKPHITITRLKQRDASFDLTSLLNPSNFSSTYDTLALCEMGEHGTCTKIAGAFKLSLVAEKS